MSRFFATLALGAALSLAGTASAADSAAGCKIDYLTAVADFSATLDQKCAALVAYSKCLDEFPRDKKLEMELFEKNEKACEPKWKEVGSPQMRTKRGNLEMEVDDAKQVTFFRHRRESINVFDMNKDVEDLQESYDATKKALENNKKELEATKKEIAAQSAKAAKALEDKVNEEIKKLQESTDAAIAKVKSDATTLKKAVDGTVTQLKADTKKQIDDVYAKMKSAADASTKAITALTTKINVDVKKSIEELKKGATDKPVHIWSGTPKAHNRGTGWHNFKLDYTDFNSAAPYFKQISATHFLVEKSGMYKIEANLMTHTNSRCWAHYQVNVGGQWINDPTHTYAYSWKQTSFTIFYPIKKGQTVYSRVYGQSCGNTYTWHGGKHSRFQMAYVGQYGSKCSGGRCII